MSSIRNERGGASLLYVIMISAILMIVTPSILFMTSNDATRNISDNHTRLANNLAISGIEAFIGYLDAYSTGDRVVYFNSYPGFVTKSYATPEGTTIQYSLIKADPIDNRSTIIMTASVGSGNLIRTKEIIYTINASNGAAETIVSTGPNAVRAPIAPGNGFYVQGETDGVTGAVPNGSLKTAIGGAIDYYKGIVTNQIAAYETNAEVCNCTNESEVRNKILNSTANPVIIQINQNMTLNGTFGTDAKPVVLIINNNFSPGNNLNLTVTGDLIIKNDLTVSNNPNITVKKVGNLYGNLFVLGTLNGDNMILSAQKMLYMSNLITKNNTVIDAGIMVVENLFDVQNNINLNIGSDLLSGSVSVKNNSTLTATAGDILVENDFSAKVGVNLTAGGVIAAGGNFEAKNNPTITTGGATSSLIIPAAGSGGGSGGSGSGTSSGWDPLRQ